MCIPKLEYMYLVHQNMFTVKLKNLHNTPGRPSTGVGQNLPTLECLYGCS